MKPFHVGAMLESFCMPIPEALKTAKEMGLTHGYQQVV